MLHWGKPTMSWFFLRRWIRDWFQLRSRLAAEPESLICMRRQLKKKKKRRRRRRSRSPHDRIFAAGYPASFLPPHRQGFLWAQHRVSGGFLRVVVNSMGIISCHAESRQNLIFACIIMDILSYRHLQLITFRNLNQLLVFKASLLPS